MDPLVFLLGGVGVAVAAFIVRNVVAKNRHEAEQQVRDAALELEMSQEAARRAREANAAAPLVDSPNPQLQLADSAKAVLSGFSELETFQDVAAWDSRAQDLANQIHAECDRLTAFVAKADAVIVTHGRSPSAPKHVHAAELQKTRDLTKQAKAAVQQLAPLYDDLLQRIDFTPDNKADQQALLKELRSQKKELALQKREQKAAATAVRREARVASSTAGISDLGVLGSSYHANSAAGKDVP